MTFPELPEYTIVNPASSATTGMADSDYGFGGDATLRLALLLAQTFGMSADSTRYSSCDSIEVMDAQSEVLL